MGLARVCGVNQYFSPTVTSSNNTVTRRLGWRFALLVFGALVAVEQSRVAEKSAQGRGTVV